MIGKEKRSLDGPTADRLLDLLATDDDFRSLFQRDPGAALAQIGHREAPSDNPLAMGFSAGASSRGSVAGCMQVGRLAAKEDILAARDQLRDMLTQGIAQNPPHLDVGFIRA